MALIFVDGFDSYTSTNGSDFVEKWPEIENSSTGMQWDSTGGRFGGGALYLDDQGASGTDSITKTFFGTAEETTENEVAFGFWLRSDGVVRDVTNHDIMRLGSINDDSAGLYIQPSSLSIGMYQYGNNVSITNGNADIDIFDGNWHWCEFRYKSSQTVGVSQCYIDGVLQYDVSGDTEFTGNGTISYITIYSDATQDTNYWIDDFVIYDDTGSELRSSVDFPIGPLKIETSRPNSTGANEDFTGVGSTSNVLNIDDSGASDDDTTYNGTETSTGAVDTFGYASLTSTGITQIIGTAVTNVSRKEGLGDIYVRGVAISSGSTSNGNSEAQTATYTAVQNPFVYDPATSTRWTTAGLDAAEFGYATSSST